MDFKATLLKQANNYSTKTAIFFENSKVSFLQLRDESFKVANYLVGKGIGKSDKIAIFLPNMLESVYSIFGPLTLGATIVPLDFMLTESEIINFISHSEAKILITMPKKGIDFELIKQNCPNLEEIIICKQEMEGCTSWNKISESCSDEPQVSVDQDDLAAIFYTSGSTGHPKGVMLQFKHFNNPTRSIDALLGISNKDIFLCGGVPFSHVGGFDYLLLLLYFASPLVLMARFNPFEFIKSIQEHKVTIFCIVPAMYVAILSLKEVTRFDLASLRYAVVFGAPSSPVLLRKFNKVCPNAFLSNGWGMTETAAPNCLLPPPIEKIESIGKFAPAMEAKIVDDQGNIVDNGKQGELWVKGEAVMLGYFKEEKLTREVLTSDGWLKTGDIAIVDDQGLYYIVGRKKEMIKVAGEIVNSSEVEEKISRHPKVKEVAVIGVEDRLRGEVPKAFLSLNDNESLEISELKDYLKEHLAHFKIPHHFEFVDELPKNRTGKIDKVSLKSKGA